MELVLILLVPFLAVTRAADSLQLDAKPDEVIPGLTQNLQMTCGPGPLTSEYRDIFFIQLLTDVNGVQTPLATLLPDKAPTLSVTDPRISVTGRLAGGNPAGAILRVTVDNPMAADAGGISCKVVGLSNNGNEVSHSATFNITVHAQADQVDAMLKQIVADLKREADRLLAQTLTLQQENQRLTQLTASKKAALAQKKTDLQQLRTQVTALQQTVASREVSLNQTAEELVKEIANVTQDAPPLRVSFNAAERTERTYASSAQIKFETVELNDGDGYNASTSIFRAPVAGVYYLTSGQLAHDTAGSSYRAYSIRKNSTVIGSSYNGDDRQSSQYSHSSTSTIVSLTPYDLIRVYQQYAATSTTTLTPYSNTANGLSTNFAGYLVY